jgi:hypothetical protein
MRRYGPIAAIVVVLAIVGAVVVLAGGDDDTASPTSTTAGGPGGTGGAPDLPPEVIPFELAQAQGIEVAWPDTCDTERGTGAVPTFFAPACFAPFDGDNGGATATGVTGDSIKIVLYQTPDDDPILNAIVRVVSDDTNAQTEETTRRMLDYYETYHETYGRSVDLEVFEATGASDNEVAARADAVTIAQEIQPFMVWSGPILAGKAFAEELAAQGVLNLQLGASSPASLYPDNDPYLLSVTISPEQTRRHVAEYIGQRLAGEPAEHAGSADLAEQERTFGIVYLETSPESVETNDLFVSLLADHGVEPAVSIPYADPISLQSDASAVIARLKEEGVTSVVFFGDPLAPGTLTTTATEQDYRPEWILTGSALVDTTTFARTYDQEQWSHAFGVSTLSARTDPSVTGPGFLYRWWNCEEPPASDGIALALAYPAITYAALAGVGTDLTAERFTRTLFGADPTTRAITAPSLSYGDKGIWPDTDYAGIDDATEIWWDPTATGPDETGDAGTGMYQYVDGGTRYLPGEWPETAPSVFETDGAVAIYTETPGAESYPDYPSPCE